MRGLVAFCLISSSIYLLNDCLDVAADRDHSSKRYQFIAAGLVSVDAAMMLYVKPGGPSEAGLWRRRKEEAAL